MPSIIRLDNNYNVGNSKSSSELSFDVGEKFAGRIVSSNDDAKTVQIRLQDGWQFEAEISNDYKELPDGIARFQVEGFEDGKLKLKIIGNSFSDVVDDDALKQFALSQGFTEEDLSLIRKMLENKMDLSKENIIKFKGILDFKNTIKNDSSEIDKFINKFIQSQNNNTQSQDIQNIKTTLEDFFAQFKTMSDDEVLLFLKCNIDLDAENIKAFKDIINNDSKVYNSIKETNNEVNNVVANENQEVQNESIKENVQQRNAQDNIISKVNEESTKNQVAQENINGNKESRVRNNTIENNINNTENVKDIDVEKNVNANKQINDNLKSEQPEVKRNFNIAKSIIPQMYTSNKSTQINVLSLLKAMTGKNNDVIKYVLSNTLENYPLQDGTMASSSVIENVLNNISEKDILMELVKSGNLDNDNIENISKESLNKCLSHIFGIKIELSDEQHSNIKNSIKFLFNQNYITNDEIEGLKQQIFDNNHKVNINNENIKEIIKNDKQQELMNHKNENIVKNAVNERVHEVKDMIKNIIKKSGIQSNGLVNDKVMSLLNKSITEFKVFNSLSNEYYYMDLPLKMKNEDYPCKLIIKDDRKNGKRVDSLDLKFIVTVKTVSIGVVDSFVKVKNKNIYVNFKCDKNAVKLLRLGETKLKEKLQSIGYTSDIVVEEKTEDVNIVNCNKFFDNGGKIHVLDRFV